LPAHADIGPALEANWFHPETSLAPEKCAVLTTYARNFRESLAGMLFPAAMFVTR
jgi:hypothetical protein